MAAYELSFAEKLADVAIDVPKEALAAPKAKGPVLYLSLLSNEIWQRVTSADLCVVAGRREARLSVLAENRWIESLCPMNSALRSGQCRSVMEAN
jgi:hypothetical protein